MSSASVPTVSVCVTTYNQDSYIGDCLVSVLAQLPDVCLEILVGDDGTGVETPGIVQRLMLLYPGVISYFKHAKNLGASQNYQFLVARARGTYIAHLDGDDFWLPGKLAAQVKWLDEHSDSVACYTNAIVADEGGMVTGVFSSRIDQEIDLEFLMRKGNFLNHSSLLYRASHRNLVLDIEGSFIDYRLHLAFARQGVLGFSNRGLTVYRHGTEHSMMKNMSDAVLELYFDALNSVLKNSSTSSFIRREALQYFWRGIFLGGVKRLDFGLLYRWAAKIHETYQDDYFSVIFLGSLRVLRGSPWLLARKLQKALFCRRDLKVMYER